MESSNLNVDDVIEAIELQNVQAFLKNSEETVRQYQEMSQIRSSYIQSVSKSLEFGFEDEESDLNRRLDRLISKFELIQEQYYARRQ